VEPTVVFPEIVGVGVGAITPYATTAVTDEVTDAVVYPVAEPVTVTVRVAPRSRYVGV
jgi:hypothetical protein